MPVPIVDTDQIVITASRGPEAEADSARQRHDHRYRANRASRRAARACSAASDAVRRRRDQRAGGVADRSPHPRRRVQSHLLFIDGIRANDPAAGNIPRFELLNADMASRIEVVRGPAIGSVGLRSDRRGDRDQRHRRRARLCRERRERIVRLRSRVGVRGVDVERRQRSPARSAASARPASTASAAPATRTAIATSRPGCAGTFALGDALELGAAGFALAARTEFDGYDLITFDHTDTLDTSRNRLAAGRIWATIGRSASAWRARISGSLLGSSQRNRQGRRPDQSNTRRPAHARRPA